MSRTATLSLLCFFLLSTAIHAWRGQGQGQGQEWEEDNPYFFQEQDFKERISNEHGQYRVLDKFTKKSHLHRGIEKYRFALFKANPQTFLVPHHSDADHVLYVIHGRASITLVDEEKSETHEIRRGDIFKVSAGTTVYLVNTDNNYAVHIAKISHTTSTPGDYKEYIGAGGENPESFYRSFSIDILEAALNVPRDELERLFGQQQGGAILRASKEQIKKLSQKSPFSEGGHGPWPFGWKSKKPFNLLHRQPSHHNRHGQMLEVTQNDFEELRDVNIDISLANITSGSMIAPNFNTKATNLGFVISGRGIGEVVCPHLSNQQQQGQEEEGGGIHYQNVRMELFPGAAFLIPAGHPATIVSSSDENLVVLCFGLNAKDNKKQFLAGRNNILKQLDREAKELSFDVEAEFADRVFNAQDEEVFLPGPGQPRGQRRGGRFESLLESAVGA